MSILSIVGLILLPACHLPLPPLPLLPMPPAISTIQVNEASDIISWQPPAEPNGQILHYNIRIYCVDGDLNRELVDTVSEVQATIFDFSTRGLSTATYSIQVGCPYELYNYLYIYCVVKSHLVICMIS